MTQQRFPYRAWIGLGGNLGDPAMAIAQALQALDGRSDTRVTAVSALFRTAPWGKTDQDWFHNACAQLETSLAPLELIKSCLDIEQQMKRVRLERWGPRLIDIDVLAMQDSNAQMIEMDVPSLTLPHPRMFERAFVLVPLVMIAPELMVHHKSITNWLADCPHDGIEIVHEADWWTASGR